MEDSRKYGTKNLFPSNDTKSTESIVLEKELKMQEEVNKALRLARNSLFVVGGILIVVNLFQVTVGSTDYTGVPFYYLYLDIFIGLIFLGLGYAAFKYPLPSLLIGLLLYVGIIVLNLVIDPSSMASGVIMKIAITYYLIKGVKNAKDAETKRSSYVDILDDNDTGELDEELLTN